MADDWKDKMDLIKIELKSVFADKKDMQKTNLELDSMNEKLIEIEKSSKEAQNQYSANTDQTFNYFKEEITELKKYVDNKFITDHAKEEPQIEVPNSDTQRGENSQENLTISPKPELSNNTSVIIKEDKKDSARPTIPPVPAIPAPQTKKIIVNNAADQKMLKKLDKRVKELEEKMVDVKVYTDENGTGIKDLKDKVHELAANLEKKAAILELKKLSGAIDDINDRISTATKEREEIKKSVKNLESSDETKSLKLKMTSLDNKVSISIKNLKELQQKVAENMGISVIPAGGQSVEIDDHNNDDKIKKVMIELDDKISEVKKMINIVKRDMEKICDDVNTKLGDRASQDSLIELENKIYKELDKVLLTITRKISGDDTKKGFKLLQAQVKRLYDFYTTSAQLLKDTTDDAVLLKRSMGGISCASCDKDVTNLYSFINQSQQQDYATWNKLPTKDSTSVKVFFIKIV